MVVKKSLAHWLLVVSALPALSACGDVVPIYYEEMALGDAPSLEQFKADTLQYEVHGKAVYLVEGDMLVGEERLEGYYAARYGADVHKSSVRQLDGIHDTVFSSVDQHNITYCVADSWGSQKPKALADMREAVHQWMAAADVAYEYVPSEDGVCSETNASVLLNVVPWSGNGGNGCFPYDCGALKINYGSDFGNYTWLGVWTHEVGHTLGLAHEADRAQCNNNAGLRALTAYDSGSAMHYDTECGSRSIGQMTALDREGLASLYGPPASTAFAVTPAAWIMTVI